MKRFNKLPKTPQGIQAVKSAKNRRLKPRFNIHVDTLGWLGATQSMREDFKHAAMIPDEPNIRLTPEEAKRFNDFIERL